MQLMTRGDTPTITISVDTTADLNTVDDILVMIKQGDLLIERRKANLIIDDETDIHFTLTHEETLSLTDGNVRIQLQILANGAITASDIATVTVGELLDDGGGLDG